MGAGNFWTCKKCGVELWRPLPRILAEAITAHERACSKRK